MDADSLLYLAGAVGESREYDCFFQGEDELEIYQLTLHSVAEIHEHQSYTNHKLLDRELVIVPGELSHCLQIVKTKLNEIKRRYGDLLEIYVKGDGTNWRDDIATLQGYKANRTSPKPYYLEEIRQYLLDNWKAIPVSGKEADDQVATRAYESSKPCVICSPDKDLDQIPGLHWNYRSNVEYTISEEEARQFFWQQVLSGDPSDNIGGCWMTGTAKAEKLVSDWLEEGCDDMEIWNRVVEHYEQSQGTPNCPYVGMPSELVALENARLVWMQTEAGRLWTPPGADPEYLEVTLDD